MDSRCVSYKDKIKREGMSLFKNHKQNPKEFYLMKMFDDMVKILPENEKKNNIFYKKACYLYKELKNNGYTKDLEKQLLMFIHRAYINDLFYKLEDSKSDSEERKLQEEIIKTQEQLEDVENNIKSYPDNINLYHTKCFLEKRLEAIHDQQKRQFNMKKPS